MSKKKSDGLSFLKQLPDLINKAVDFFDSKTESSANRAIPVTSGRAIDKAFMDNLQKSIPTIAKNHDEAIRRKSYEFDRDVGLSDLGFRDRNSAITFETLQRMATRDSIVSAIIVTRTGQISNFSRPRRDKYGMGYKVGLKDANEKMSEEDIKRCTELEEWFLNTGYRDDRFWREQMSFEEFLRRIIPDRLTYDAVSIEVVPCEDGTIHHFIPVSSGTIRFASPRMKNYKNFMMPVANILGDEVYVERPEDLQTPPEDFKYIQVYKGIALEGFSEDELIYRQANPSNEPATNGYSIPELERLVNVITAHLYAETHNRSFFTGGFSTPGFLHFKADIPQEQMDGLRRAIESQMTGSQNAFRTALIATDEEISWIPVETNNKDMEWSLWMEYLIKIICAIFQIDPAEIGFWNLSQGGASLNDGNKNEQILKQSKDKGLRPMLRFVESVINSEIMTKLGDEISSRYEFRFVGLESEERMQEVERHDKEVRSKKTVNEVRAETGEPPLPGMDDMILDPIYFQWWSTYSPSAIEARVKNQFYERLLINKYQAKLESILGPGVQLSDETTQELGQEWATESTGSNEIYRSMSKATQAQLEAGNYKKKHIKFQGLDIAIETEAGEIRSGTNRYGKKWSNKMAHDYGYIKRTEGADGDHVDVFIGPSKSSDDVFVVNQINPKTGEFDEHKVMLGFESSQDAEDAYLSNYDKNWKGLGDIKQMSMEDFKKWLSDGDTTIAKSRAVKVEYYQL